MRNCSLQREQTPVASDPDPIPTSPSSTNNMVLFLNPPPKCLHYICSLSSPEKFHVWKCLAKAKASLHRTGKRMKAKQGGERKWGHHLSACCEKKLNSGSKHLWYAKEQRKLWHAGRLLDGRQKGLWLQWIAKEFTALNLIQYSQKINRVNFLSLTLYLIL